MNPRIRSFHPILWLLLFGFSVLWGGLFFAQFMLLWYGNLPEEVGFIATRMAASPIMRLIRLMKVALGATSGPRPKRAAPIHAHCGPCQDAFSDGLFDACLAGGGDHRAHLHVPVQAAAHDPFLGSLDDAYWLCLGRCPAGLERARV